MVNAILFPSDYFDTAKVDPALQYEYDATLETGLFDVLLFAYDKWFGEGKLVLSKSPDVLQTAVYRGWMMKPDQYDLFYSELLKRNIQLITSPEQYRLMHIFPNIYESVKADAVKMEVFPLHSRIDVEQLKKKFKRFMVKDYVKSVKGTEFPKYFDQSITQEDFDRWMEVFYKYRGKLLTGGICIKEYVNLKRYGDKTNEYRVFYINHCIASVSRNSGQGVYTKLPPQDLIEKYRNLESPYYTIDFAELEDESWIVVEVGDGEVSGLSDNQDYYQYFKTLYNCFC